MDVNYTKTRKSDGKLLDTKTFTDLNPGPITDLLKYFQAVVLEDETERHRYARPSP